MAESQQHKNQRFSEFITYAHQEIAGIKDVQRKADEPKKISVRRVKWDELHPFTRYVAEIEKPSNLGVYLRSVDSFGALTQRRAIKKAKRHLTKPRFHIEVTL